MELLFGHEASPVLQAAEGQAGEVEKRGAVDRGERGPIERAVSFFFSPKQPNQLSALVWCRTAQDYLVPWTEDLRVEFTFHFQSLFFPYPIPR